MISALVFDLDDTLYPEHVFVRSGFAAVDRWLQERRGLTGFADEAARLFLEGARGRIFDEVLRRLAVDDASELVPTLVEVYRAHEPQLSLFPDAEWALAYFGRRMKLGLITDGHAVTQRNKFAALGLAKYFRAVVFTDDFGRESWKPSPACFQRIEAALACPAHECAYVGDNLAKDFVAPNRLGWLTVHLQREGGEYRHVVAADLPADHRAQHEIASLRELEAILATSAQANARSTGSVND